MGLRPPQFYLYLGRSTAASCTEKQNLFTSQASTKRDPTQERHPHGRAVCPSDSSYFNSGDPRLWATRNPQSACPLEVW